MHKKRIIDWLNNYKSKTNCNGVVLGVSGGKDSTVVAMLSKLVFGDNVFGVIMPNGAQRDIDDAINVCETLNIKYRIVNIGVAYDSIIDSIKYCPGLDDIHINDKAKTNIPPRLRMTTLYAIAQTLGYRVIGTGNSSERFIGWCTKFGDMACDLNPIAHLTCQEVVDLGLSLCEEFNLSKELITKKPSDGLTGKSDEDNFGFTYLQLDNYMHEHTSGSSDIDDKIENMHLSSRHKVDLPYTVYDNFN